MKYGQITFSDLKSVWRIVAAVAICQLVGGAISLALAPHHFSFMNFWLGGAAGTLPGFALGVAWQLRSKTPNRGWIQIACFLGFISVAITCMAFGVVFPRIQTEMRNLEQIKQLQADGLRLIEVFDGYGSSLVTRISDAESLTAFAQGISDAVGHSPNHPRYSDSWYVIVSGKTRHEFELHLNPRFPQCVIGYFVVKSGDSTSYNGTFESKGLRPWVETHLMKTNTNEAIKATP